MVERARAEEIGEFRKHGVWTKVAISEAHRVTSKRPIKTRWVDINKGDEVNPSYRSRLVAKEIKKHSSMDLFAATAPWGQKRS